jgi:hypothetical protein
LTMKRPKRSPTLVRGQDSAWTGSASCKGARGVRPSSQSRQGWDPRGESDHQPPAQV